VPQFLERTGVDGLGKACEERVHLMSRLIFCACLLVVPAACTTAGGASRQYVENQTGTYCPEGAPWYYCTGYRERP
jgi:hypothetical protein